MMRIFERSAVIYLHGDMRTTFVKPGIGGSRWTHDEGQCSKYFKLDDAQKSVSVYNQRRDQFLPICPPGSGILKWSDEGIEVDGLATAAADATANLDFRRAFTLDFHANRATLTVVDFGGSAGQENMRWIQTGQCRPAAVDDAKPLPYPPGPRNPLYVDAQVFPISDAERDEVLANFYGNTLTGLSGGRFWFHMWFFADGVAYTGDGDDITAEGAARKWYVGKEASGAYRLCDRPIPPEGTLGCYPLSKLEIGDRWKVQNLYGDGDFELLRGRQ